MARLTPPDTWGRGRRHRNLDSEASGFEKESGLNTAPGDSRRLRVRRVSMSPSLLRFAWGGHGASHEVPVVLFGTI
jgi:hypothetical protein